jgi:hypothetical protein
MKTSFALASDALRPNVATRFRTGFTVATPVATCYFSTRTISQRTPGRTGLRCHRRCFSQHETPAKKQPA